MEQEFFENVVYLYMFKDKGECCVCKIVFNYLKKESGM